MTKLLRTEYVNAMVKALKETKSFKIERTPDTVVATHNESGKEVLRALRNRDVWITRMTPINA